MPTHDALTPPRSAGSRIAAPAAIFVAVGTYALLRRRDLTEVELSAAIVVAVASALAAIDYRRANRDVPRPRQALGDILGRSLRHWLEAMLGFGATLSFWWLLDAEYGRPEFQPLRDAASLALPWVPPLTFLGVLLSAWRLGPAREVATPLADFMLSLGALKSTEALRQRLLALLVRAIFLPLNFCALAQSLAYFRSREAHLFSSAWPHTHAELLLLIYTVMIATIVPGYLFSSRLLATQVRQVDATASGWAATLLCYRPLSVVVFERWLNYRGASALPGVERTWSTVAEGWPALIVAIGTALVLLEIVHLWAEASFGLRASNLSHRGIITHGPYRWCKHPIYLSKCLGWLLLYLPFAMSTSMQSLRATILFGGVCILYAMRAHTEERLLASDPDYVAYALWMDRHGLFAGVGRLLPIIKFCHRFEKWQRP